jgi:hypothetical protein
VRSFHVGFDPDANLPLNKTLAREIDSILEGKPPAASGAKTKEPTKPDGKTK